jgi:hypothetical protein
MTEMNKVYQSVESIRHLEATRHSTVDGMNANNRFIIDRERASWAHQLELKTERLRFEERETREYLKTYLEHLKRMRDIKEDLDMIQFAK